VIDEDIDIEKLDHHHNNNHKANHNMAENKNKISVFSKRNILLTIIVASE
jgi:hypothetical protein